MPAASAEQAPLMSLSVMPISPIPGVKFVKIPDDLRYLFDQHSPYPKMGLQALVREVARLRDALTRIIQLDAHYYQEDESGAATYAGVVVEESNGADMHGALCVTCIAHEALSSRYGGDSEYVYVYE